MEGLTQRQREVMLAVEQMAAELGYSPSVRELCTRLKVRSTCTIQKHLRALERKGYLVKAGGKSRTLQIGRPGRQARRPGIVPVPLVGRVAAGQPVEAVENIEDYVPLGRELVGSQDVFLLRVRGDSMSGDGISDGDLLLVRKQSTAQDGDVVVAIVGGEATVKRFKRDGKRIRLQPSNPAHQPIVTEEAEVVGRAVMSLHRL